MHKIKYIPKQYIVYPHLSCNFLVTEVLPVLPVPEEVLVLVRVRVLVLHQVERVNTTLAYARLVIQSAGYRLVVYVPSVVLGKVREVSFEAKVMGMLQR